MRRSRVLALVLSMSACTVAGAAGGYRVVPMQGAADGTLPAGRLVATANGALVGTAEAGGAHGDGTIWRIDARGRITVLHAFDASDGYSIVAGLTAGPDGWLYGATTLGAANGLGGLFKIAPDGRFVLLHSFNDGADHGASQVGSPLTLGADGNFYGTTVLSSGFPEHNGTVFKMTPEGEVTILYVFGARARNPYAGVTFGPDGRLYGLTRFDGREDCGVAYSLASDGTDYRIVHQFDDQVDGCQPEASLVEGLDGQLYGATQFGGPIGGQGTLFRLDTGSGRVDVLHVFHDNDPLGADPLPGLSRDDAGMFYGSTLHGATNGQGGIFSLAPDGTVTLLHAFAADGQDGSNPASPPTPLPDGSLAGSMLDGGASGDGAVYRLRGGTRSP
jgi:uncharacterized repeat protein (TIGR03803 family)